MADVVYQTNKFEVLPLRSPEVAETLEGWGIPDALDAIPSDAIDQMTEANAFLIYNTANGTVGVIDPVTLSTSFEEESPSTFMQEVRATFIEQVQARSAELEELDESEDFYRGASAFLDIVAAVRANRQGGVE